MEIKVQWLSEEIPGKLSSLSENRVHENFEQYFGQIRLHLSDENNVDQLKRSDANRYFMPNEYPVFLSTGRLAGVLGGVSDYDYTNDFPLFRCSIDFDIDASERLFNENYLACSRDVSLTIQEAISRRDSEEFLGLRYWLILENISRNSVDFNVVFVVTVSSVAWLVTHYPKAREGGLLIVEDLRKLGNILTKIVADWMSDKQSDESHDENHK